MRGCASPLLDISAQSRDHMIARVRENRASFEGLVDITRKRFEQKRLSSAAVYAQIAAHFAWCNHTGIYYSNKLENLLIVIGSMSVSREEEVAVLPEVNDNPKSVLHVTTVAYRVGGHTPLLSRWMQQDAQRVHSVVLTRQETGEIPRELNEITKKRGGTIIRLDLQTNDLLKRAEWLRQIATAFDRVE